MSNFWRRGNRGVAVALFLGLFASLVFAGPYADLNAKLQGRPDSEAVAGLKRIAGGDEEAQSALGDGPEAARAYVALRATLEGATPTKVPTIGAGPGDERTASSWLGRAFERLRWPSFDLPKSQRPQGGLGPWATILMWTLLACAGGMAVFLLARYARLPGLRRKGQSLVEAEEPVQSADEWLEQANALIAQGRFREAVRGLYVAGLLRFDEAGVARFDRNQTNWEHLRRIEASPKKPSETEVRDATQRFDRVWYGHQAVTAGDASAMRAWYDALVRRLGEAKAA